METVPKIVYMVKNTLNTFCAQAIASYAIMKKVHCHCDFMITPQYVHVKLPNPHIVYKNVIASMNADSKKDI